MQSYNIIFIQYSIQMEQALIFKTKTYRLSQRQYSSVNNISKSAAGTRSQSKPLQRYFYRKDSNSFIKIQPNGNTRKSIINIDNTNIYKRNIKSAYKKNINEDNQYSKINQSVDIPIITSPLLINYNENNQLSMSKLQMITSEGYMHKKTSKRSSDWKLAFIKNPTMKLKNVQIDESKIKLNLEQTKQTKQKQKKLSKNIDLVIKKHKADNVKQIQQNLRSTLSRGGFRNDKLILIKDYNRKCGYNEDSKIFIWNSQDEYIKRILTQWGWIHNQSQQSPFFHIKWTYNPSSIENKINQKQLMNHYKNSHQLTSKSYLCKNLKNNQSSFGKIQTYFPKCYDVGNITQWNQFMLQYRNNIMNILLKKIYKLFCHKNSKVMEEYDKYYEYIFRHDLYSTDEQMIKNKNSKSQLRNKGFRQIYMEDYRNRNNDFIVHIQLLTQALKYWRFHRKQKQQYVDEGYHFLQFDESDFIGNFPMLQKYALMNELDIPNKQTNFSKQMYATPSKILIQRISKQYQFVKCTNNLFPTYGQNNIWIVKPTSTSRGSGIYLTTDIWEIQSSSKNIQSRLVQKYIQKPLLITNINYPQLQMRKFDIRQWVLLKSIDPLQIYMFSQCYLRLCYDKYKINNIEQLNRHLTNYSINKQKFKNKQDSVIPLSYLKQVLANQYKIDWNTKIKPKIQQIIIKSVKSCIQNMEDYCNSCFQLLGYDILIDEEMNPWLLQVNMSPACEERTEWLKQYLNDMGTGLLQIVLPQQLLPSQIQQIKYKWELIYLQQSYFNRKKQTYQGLQMVGNSVQLKNEKKIDRHILENKMAYKIQKFFKIYLPKYQKSKLIRKQAKIKIYQYLQSLKQSLNYKKLCKIKYCTTINKYLCVLPTFKKYQISLKDSNIRIIQKYMKPNKSVKQYLQKQSVYKKQIILILANVIVKKKQLQSFCKQIMKANNKIGKIQNMCKQFMKKQKNKRKQFQKYFKTIISVINYKNKQKQIIQLNNINIINKYLKSISLCKITQNKTQKHNINTLSKYIKSLTCRQQFYNKRLNIFLYNVGRVVRVSRRRARCEYLNELIKNWRRQKYQYQIDIISKSLYTFLAYKKYKIAYNGILRNQKKWNKMMRQQ